MKYILLGSFLILGSASCGKKPSPRSAALPDNLISDKPIVLKEGQAIVLMKAGDPHLMIAASVVDGKLCIAEVNPKGHDFGVTWKNSETWETSTIVTDGKNITCVMDKNMDGFADFRTETTPGGTHRFELKGQDWVQLKTDQKQSEQVQPAPPTSGNAPRFIAPTLARANKLTDDSVEAAYGDWSFCALCTLAKSEYDDELRWYRFIPVKIYWGSHDDVRGKLLDSRLSSEKSAPSKTRQYLIMVRNPDGVAPGEAYIRKTPFIDEPMPAKWYGLKGDSEFTVEEIKQAIEKMRDKMRKRFPIDEAPEE